MAMAKQYPNLNFLISDIGGCFDATLRSISSAISRVLDQSNFSLVKMASCEDFLLTLHDQSPLDENFECKVMALIETDGHFVTLTKVELESILALKFENKKGIDELMIELQIKDIFKNQAGNAKDVKTFIANESLIMALVIFNSHIGDDLLCEDLYLIESLVKVYKVKSSEFLEIYFGKFGMLEDHMEEIWSCGNSDNHNIVTILISHNKLKAIKSEQKHEEAFVELIIACDDLGDEIYIGETSNESGSHHKTGYQKTEIGRTREFDFHHKTDYHHQKLPAKYGRREKKNWKEIKITNSINEERRTIAVNGEYALEKCHLLQKLCNDLTNKECKLYVDVNSKEVTIIGIDMGMLQKYLNMFLLQIKMFHCEVLRNLNKKLLHLLTQNENVKKHFSGILAENQLDSVVLFQDTLNRPAVLGLNKIKTRNFIEWFGKFFVKESVKITISHIHNLEFGELKRSILLLELNRLVSTDVNNGEILIHGLVTDVLVVADGSKKIVNQMRKRLSLRPPSIQQTQVPTKLLASPRQDVIFKLKSLFIKKHSNLTNRRSTLMRDERSSRPRYPSTESSKTVTSTAKPSLFKHHEPSQKACLKSTSSNQYHNFVSSKGDESLYAKCNRPLTSAKSTTDLSKRVTSLQKAAHNEVHLSPIRSNFVNLSPPQVQLPYTVSETRTLHASRSSNTPLPSSFFDFPSARANAGYSTPHAAYKMHTTSAAPPSSSLRENRTNPFRFPAASSPNPMSSQRSLNQKSKEDKEKRVIL